MDTDRCSDCLSVYCSFTESDRQKLEMWDDVILLLTNLFEGLQCIDPYEKPLSRDDEILLESLLKCAKKIQEE